MLSYVDYSIYWYTYEELGKWCVITLGKIFHMNFLGYENWFIFIKISQLRYQFFSVDQDRYDTYVVVNYLDTATIKESSNVCNTTSRHSMIFAK